MDLQQRLEAEQVYRAAVGPRADYYVPKFIGFDTYDASRMSWSWPAFFFTFPWMLYRRMFGYAAVYFLVVPVVATVLSGMVRIGLPPKLAPFFALPLPLLIFFIVPPLYANAMYHTTVAARIRKARDDSTTLEEQIGTLESQKSTSIVALIVGAVLAVASAGWSVYRRDLQAAQPQLADAIAHTGYIQADLEVFYRSHGGRWPRDAAEMGLHEFANGSFIDSVEVRDGDIRITLGGKSVGRLQGKLLVMKPIGSAPTRFDWVCVEHAENPVPKRYWPRTCDTRDVRIAATEQPPTMKVTLMQTIEFAAGKARVQLPDTHIVTVSGASLTSMFGAKQDHKLEMSLVGKPLAGGANGALGATLVRLQAARAGLTATLSEHRAVMSEPGSDIELNGRPHEVTHWQIGAANCVFTMTLTAPLPLSTDHRDFYYTHLDSILQGVECAGG